MSDINIYQELAARVRMPNSRWIPKILEKIITPEEGQKLLGLPLSIAEYAEKHGIDEAEAERVLVELADKGVCLPLPKDGVEKYCCVSNIIQVHDATIHGVLNKNYPDAPMEIVYMWRQFRETEWFEMLKLMELLPPQNHGRCIPSWSTVKDNEELLPVENLKTILENAPVIGVVDCPCRWIEVQEGSCKVPTFNCISLTEKSVKYIVDRKIGKQLTLEEGFKLLEECEEHGLIPTTGRRDQPKQLCMCTVPECIILRGQVKYGYNIWDRSRFDATVDADTCDGCETCVDRCQFDAISMKDDAASVDLEKCFGCGVCAVTCTTGALSMKLARPVEQLTGELTSP